MQFLGKAHSIIFGCVKKSRLSCGQNATFCRQAILQKPVWICLESTVAENTNTSQLKCDFPNSWSIAKNLQDAWSTFFKSASHSGGARLRTSRNCANWPPVRVKKYFFKKSIKNTTKNELFRRGPRHHFWRQQKK